MVQLDWCCHCSETKNSQLCTGLFAIEPLLHSQSNLKLSSPHHQTYQRRGAPDLQSYGCVSNHFKMQVICQKMSRTRRDAVSGTWNSNQITSMRETNLRCEPSRQKRPGGRLQTNIRILSPVDDSTYRETLLCSAGQVQ